MKDAITGNNNHCALSNHNPTLTGGLNLFINFLFDGINKVIETNCILQNGDIIYIRNFLLVIWPMSLWTFSTKRIAFL